MFSRRVKLISLFRGYDTLGKCNTSAMMRPTRTMARDIPAGKAHGSKERTPLKALAAKKVNKKIKIKMKKRFFCSFFVLHLHVVRISMIQKMLNVLNWARTLCWYFKLLKSLGKSIPRNSASLCCLAGRAGYTTTLFLLFS
jgi:hypothetical protein